MCKRTVRGILWTLVIMSVLPLMVMLFSTIPIEDILLGFIGAGVGFVLAIAVGYPLRKLFLTIEDWLDD